MQNKLSRSRKEALKEKGTTINLYGCTLCGLVFNADFNERLVDYSPEYDNSPDNSALFSSYLKNLARRLYEKYSLKNKHLVEIGCGKGSFLELLLNLGARHISGFDPAYEKRGDKLDRFVRADVWSSKKTRRADFIVAKEVFEHIPEIRKFVEDVLRRLAPAGALYIEVPNLCWILKNKVFFDFTYEHCNYFTPRALFNLFNQFGWGKISFSYGVGGQYIGMEIQRGRGREPRSNLDFGAISVFVDKETKKWKKEISRWGRFVIWGVGGKGVTFLNRLGINYLRSPFAIDINPRKHNRFVPITGQKVVSPQILHKEKFDSIIIMNPIYGKEIKKMAKDCGFKGKFILPYS